MTDYMKFIPIALIAVSLIGSAVTAQIRIGDNGSEIEDLSASIDDNEDSIEAIQRTLIQRQGETRLQVQRIETEQVNQGKDLSEILLLLKQITTNQ